MKKKIAIVAGILVVLACSFYYMLLPLFISIGTATTIFNKGSSTICDMPDSDTAFGGIWENWKPNDSLPYYKYKVLDDSAARVRDERKRLNESPSLAGWTVGYIGFYNNEGAVNVDTKKAEQAAYYFVIEQCELDHDVTFFVQNNTYNLAYQKIDSVKHSGSDSTAYCHYERKQIKARYAAKEKRLLIPISSKAYNLYTSFFSIVGYILLIAMFYVFIGLGLKIVVSISQSQAFTLANIRRFKIMSFALGAYIMLSCLMPLLLKTLFSSYFIKEFSLPSFWRLLVENIFTLFFAVALFIISQAFKRGYKLQQEQDLTI
jgi:hypothetical protein